MEVRSERVMKGYLERLGASAIARSVGVDAHAGGGDAVGAFDGDDGAVSGNERGNYREAEKAQRATRRWMPMSMEAVTETLEGLRHQRRHHRTTSSRWTTCVPWQNSTTVMADTYLHYAVGVGATSTPVGMH